MATWIVQHAVSKQAIAEHGTKKAATAQADEMTDAHRKIGAKHEGHDVTFQVVKAEEPAAEPVEEE